MTTTNIETFNDLTGRILGELYLKFPMPTYLGADAFVGSVMEFSEEQGMELPSNDAEFFIATAEWLISAGYINGVVTRYTYVSNAVLTAKGLEVLNAIPKSLTYGPSLGEQMADAIKEGGKDTLKGLVTEALGMGARLLSPYVGIP